MNFMYVSLVAIRSATRTTVRTLHTVPVVHDGPQKAIERFVENMALQYQKGWTVNAMQITQHEFDIFHRKLNLEEAKVWP